MKSKTTWIVAILVIIILFYLVSCVIMPLFKKDVKSEDLDMTLTHLNSKSDADESIICIDSNTDALIKRIELIESAKESIIFATFNFKDDSSGKDIICALKAASERGVKIRLIIDGISGFTNFRKSDNLKYLSTLKNVEIKIYNPVKLLKPYKINYRMHDKYIIADNKAYILGGRNVKNLSLGDYSENKDIDRDVLVISNNNSENNSLYQVKNYFEKIWSYKDSYTYSCTKKFPDSVCNNLTKRYKNLRDKYSLSISDINSEKNATKVKSIKLITNPINASNKEPLLFEAMMEIMKGKNHVTIETPYIICDKMMYKGLYDIDKSTSETELITNAIESGANPWGCADYVNQKKNLVKTGINLYEYIGSHSAHTKTVLIDNNISLIGSFNFDMRSAYLDTEMMLVIDCPELNEYLTKINEESKRKSRRYTDEGTYIKSDDCTEPEIPIGKKIFYMILRAVVVPFRHLL